MTEQEYYDTYYQALWAFIITPCGSIGEKAAQMARRHIEDSFYGEFNKRMSEEKIKIMRDKAWNEKRGK